MPERANCSAVAIACLLLSGGGCRTWLPSAVDAPASPSTAAEARARRPSQTIPLDVVFARHGDQDAAMCEELWGLVDEQIFDHDVRRRLHANGLRAGVVTAQLPPHLAERFVPSAAAAGDSLPTAMAENPALMRHVLRLLPGRSSDVVSATGLDPLVLLEREPDGVRGTTYRDASPLFSLRAWPAADGRVRLKLSPMIKHGPVERSWVGDDGMFRLEMGQRRDVLDGLELETTVPMGSMLLVGCAGGPASAAGDAFFRDRIGGDRAGQRVLAIRPVPQQHSSDPLFATPHEHEDEEPFEREPRRSETSSDPGRG